jgi:hypothetical protein
MAQAMALSLIFLNKLLLGLRIREAKATQSQAKATGFRAKPSQHITSPNGWFDSESKGTVTLPQPVNWPNLASDNPKTLPEIR